MKTEAEMRAEGRQISRAIDNYQPLTEQPEAQPQTTLDEAETQ
jgi:hypothetical protein